MPNQNIAPKTDLRAENRLEKKVTGNPAIMIRQYLSGMQGLCKDAKHSRASLDHGVFAASIQAWFCGQAPDKTP